MADLLAEIAISEGKIKQQTRKVFDQLIKDTAAFEKQSNAILAKFGEGFLKSETTAAQQRQLTKLKREFDPLFAASERYKSSVERLNALHAKNPMTSGEYASAMKRINEEYKRAADGADNLGQSFGRAGGSLQNIGFQVGDFATQVGAGTSATQALGQQLPQLLGGFGAIGAVAGAAAAILIPLGAALFKAAGDSETLDESLEGLTASTDAMAEAADRAATPLSDLREQYGELADEIARANGAQAFFTAQLAKRDLVGVAGKASKELFGGAFQVDRARELEGQAEWEQRGLRIMQMAGTLKISNEQTRELFDGLDDLGKARGPEEVVRITDRLLAILQSAPGALDAFSGDIAQVSELGQAAADMIAAQQAGGAAIRATNKQLLDSYDKTTQALVGLTEELDQAEKARAEAASRRNAREVAMWDRVIAKIKETVRETKAAADGTTEAAARMARAYQQYGTSRTAATASIGDAASFIRDRERFEPLAYDDGKRDGSGKRVGPPIWRAGFGSDEITLSDGSIVKITQGMRVSLEDANRDLERRIKVFQQGIIGEIGGERWDEFTVEQQAALTSIAYNYGSLPDRIIAAVRGGAPEDIANSIGGLANDNGGINSKRRFMEASAFGPASVAQSDFDASETARKEAEKETVKALREQTAERDRLRKAAEEYGKTLERNLVTGQQEAELSRERAAALQAIEAAGMEGPAKAAAIAEVNGEYEKQRLIFSLIEDAKRRQVDLDTLMTGSTLTYAQAIAALGDAAKQKVIVDQQQAAALDTLGARQAFYNDLQSQMKDGLIDSIIAGESFADVLANVADMLARAALQAALFNEGPFASSGGGGGGLLGGLFGMLAGKRALGGPVSAGGAYLVGERGPEIIVPRSAGTVIPNHQLGGGGMVYSPTFHIGGRVTTEDLMAVRQESQTNFVSMQKSMPAQVKMANARPRRRN